MLRAMGAKARAVVCCGALYFAVVFGAGFALGALRTLYVAPHLGTRWAELLELPLMLLVCVLVAHWVLRRSPVRLHVVARLGVGLVALVLMLAADFGVVLQLRGLSMHSYIASFDPVAGSAFLASLGAMALIPLALHSAAIPPSIFR